jgi:cytidyltransferase-like protein
MSSWVDHSFFFTALERARIAAMGESDTNSSKPSSVTTRLLSGLWNFISRVLLPETVAPNAITLVGSVCVMQAYQVISMHYAGQPYGATVVAVVLLIVSIACSSLDGVHAKRCRSASIVGDIFSRASHAANHIFFALTFFEIVRLHDVTTRWYLILAMQLFDTTATLGRINADNLKQTKGKNLIYHMAYFFRESEISFILVLLLVSRQVLPQRSFHVSLSSAQTFYMVTFASSILLIVMARMERFARLSVLACLLARIAPMFMILPLSETTNLSIIADAAVVGLLNIELYVSHLAQRRIHAAVILICLGALFNDVLALSGVVLYIIGMLADISYSTRIPLFVPIRNVFIDGVFDLCHIGHKRVMEHALKHGNRLLAGVISDEDCVTYKRRPVMTTEERCREVAACKYVTQVIPGSPLVQTEEFLKKHNIHVVVIGEEYDFPEDKYYAVPRRMGMIRTAPRTSGMSTSVLIDRIRAADAAELAPKDKLSGASKVKMGA